MNRLSIVIFIVSVMVISPLFILGWADDDCSTPDCDRQIIKLGKLYCPHDCLEWWVFFYGGRCVHGVCVYEDITVICCDGDPIENLTFYCPVMDCPI